MSALREASTPKGKGHHEYSRLQSMSWWWRFWSNSMRGDFVGQSNREGDGPRPRG